MNWRMVGWGLWLIGMGANALVTPALSWTNWGIYVTGVLVGIGATLINVPKRWWAQ